MQMKADVGLRLQGGLDLRRQPDRLGADDRVDPQPDRAAQPLGEDRGDDRADRLARQRDAEPGRGRVAEHHQPQRFAGEARAVEAVRPRRRGHGDRYGPPGGERLGQ